MRKLSAENDDPDTEIQIAIACPIGRQTLSISVTLLYPLYITAFRIALFTPVS